MYSHPLYLPLPPKKSTKGEKKSFATDVSTKISARRFDLQTAVCWKAALTWLKKIHICERHSNGCSIPHTKLEMSPVHQENDRNTTLRGSCFPSKPLPLLSSWHLYYCQLSRHQSPDLLMKATADEEPVGNWSESIMIGVVTSVMQTVWRMQAVVCTHVHGSVHWEVLLLFIFIIFCSYCSSHWALWPLLQKNKTIIWVSDWIIHFPVYMKVHEWFKE